MTVHEIDDYFGKVGEWMKKDLGREIELARLSLSDEGKRALSDLGIPPGGGNLLAALGLVAYTEALGLLRFWNANSNYGQRTYGQPSECFLAFFDEMADGRYRSWRLDWEGRHGGKAIYNVLRSGLVHEYRPKVDSEFWIGSEDEALGLSANGDGDDVLIFKVAPYYRDFCAELDELHKELRANRNAEIPPPKGGGPGQGAGFTGGSVGSGPAMPRAPFVSPSSAPGG